MRQRSARGAVRSPLPAAPREVCPRRIPITARNVIRVYAACRCDSRKRFVVFHGRTHAHARTTRTHATPRVVRMLIGPMRIDENCPRVSTLSAPSPGSGRAELGRSMPLAWSIVAAAWATASAAAAEVTATGFCAVTVVGSSCDEDEAGALASAVRGRVPPTVFRMLGMQLHFLLGCLW
jgi:hypothetical protein